MLRRSLLGALLGLLSAVMSSCGSNSSASGDSGSGADSAATTQGSTQASNAATGTSGTSTSSATTSAATMSGATTAAGGSGGSSSDGATTTAASTTGGGGSAGNTTVASSTTSTSAGGSGGDPGDPCPSEPPVGNTPCSGPSANCAYEDCAGAGRTVATCTQGTWFVDNNACTEMVYCSGGSEICSAGEICLIMAGGAFLQECVPNTCEGQAVDCDCTEGCSGDCSTFASAEAGITITCDTCPDDLCP